MSGERFAFPHRQEKQSEVHRAKKLSDNSFSREESEIPSTKPSGNQKNGLHVSTTTQSTKAERSPDARPRKDKAKNSQLDFPMKTIAAQLTAQSSSTASLPDLSTNKGSRKRRYERQTSDVSEVSSSYHQKRMMSAAQSSSSPNFLVTRSRPGEFHIDDNTALTSGKTALPSNALKGKSKDKNGEKSDASTPPTPDSPQQPAVETRVSHNPSIPNAKSVEKSSSSPRKQKRNLVPHLDIVDMESPEPSAALEQRSSDKGSPSSIGKRKRQGADSHYSTPSSERKKLKHSKTKAEQSGPKEVFPKNGSAIAGPSKQNKGKGKELATASNVQTDNSYAGSSDAFNGFLGDGLSNSPDEISILTTKIARSKLTRSSSSIDLQRTRCQTMPPISSLKSARPSIRDTLFPGNFMDTLKDQIKDIFTQSLSQLQKSAQPTASARVASGSPPSLASASHQEIIRYYGGREEPFDEDQLVQIIKNPSLSGLKRNKVAEHAFSTNGSVRASYRHLQTKLTGREWAKVAPKQKKT